MNTAAKTDRLALLRAVNVGGRNKIAMTELRELFVELGLCEPQTLIQSGNVVFDNAGLADAECAEVIRAGIAQRFGHDVEVLIRSRRELVDIASARLLPTPPESPKFHHVAFFDRAPTPAVVDLLDPAEFAPDECIVDGRHAHLHYPNGSGRSKLTIALLERRFAVVGTARNINTVGRLVELLAKRPSR